MVGLFIQLILEVSFKNYKENDRGSEAKKSSRHLTTSFHPSHSHRKIPRSRQLAISLFEGHFSHRIGALTHWPF